MEKVRLGILGVGNMGTAHLKNIKGGKCPEIEVTAVCDLKDERLDFVKENSINFINSLKIRLISVSL